MFLIEMWCLKMWHGLGVRLWNGLSRQEEAECSLGETTGAAVLLLGVVVLHAWWQCHTSCFPCLHFYSSWLLNVFYRLTSTSHWSSFLFHSIVVHRWLPMETMTREGRQRWLNLMTSQLLAMDMHVQQLVATVQQWEVMLEIGEGEITWSRKRRTWRGLAASFHLVLA